MVRIELRVWAAECRLLRCEYVGVVDGNLFLLRRDLVLAVDGKTVVCSGVQVVGLGKYPLETSRTRQTICGWCRISLLLNRREPARRRRGHRIGGSASKACVDCLINPVERIGGGDGRRCGCRACAARVRCGARAHAMAVHLRVCGDEVRCALGCAIVDASGCAPVREMRGPVRRCKSRRVVHDGVERLRVYNIPRKGGSKAAIDRSDLKRSVMVWLRRCEKSAVAAAQLDVVLLEGVRLARVAACLLVARAATLKENMSGGILRILVEEARAWTRIRLEAGVVVMAASIIVARRWRGRLLHLNERRLGRNRCLRLGWEMVWPLLGVSMRVWRLVVVVGLDKRWRDGVDVCGGAKMGGEIRRGTGHRLNCSRNSVRIIIKPPLERTIMAGNEATTESR